MTGIPRSTSRSGPRAILLATLAAAALAAEAGDGLAGTYSLDSQGVRLVLQLRVTPQGGVTGVLESTKGAHFALDGQVQDGVAVGVCVSDEGGLFFEAQLQGAQLLFAMIEPDAGNMPDYSRARALVFTRIAEGGNGALPSARPAGPASGTPAAEVPAFLVGTWVTMTSHTQTSYTLWPDGTFTSGYEASYSGGSVPGGTTDWGLARQDSGRGRWMARGTREQGTLVLQHPDGSQDVVEYRVHVESGEPYWNEYVFDGTLYARQ